MGLNPCFSTLHSKVEVTICLYIMKWIISYDQGLAAGVVEVINKR